MFISVVMKQQKINKWLIYIVKKERKKTKQKKQDVQKWYKKHQS